MRWRVGVEHIDTDDLVVGARCQVLVVAREAHGVYGAGVRAYGGELLGLVVVCVVRVEDGVGRPDTDVGICERAGGLVFCCSRQERPCVPPAAVTSREPSGEMWQLYTSWSRRSPAADHAHVSQQVSRSLWEQVGCPRTAMCQPERLYEMHVRRAPECSSLMFPFAQCADVVGGGLTVLDVKACPWPLSRIRRRAGWSLSGDAN